MVNNKPFDTFRGKYLKELKLCIVYYFRRKCSVVCTTVTWVHLIVGRPLA